jgi:UDP-N-acetylglucosamine 1-carboxyvinyltransferase
LVTGGAEISGDIEPSGNKNEALPLLSCCLLSDDTMQIENIPNILDVYTMENILEYMGVSVVRKNSTRTICSKGIKNLELPAELCQNIRASFLLLAPLLHRFGKILIPIPGGDNIGQRRLDSHFSSLQKSGIRWKNNGKNYLLEADAILGADILLDEASVMATENLIMVAVLAKGTTKIFNAACEPHVQSLCVMLNKMGAKISGIGSNLLQIEGVKVLSGVSHKVGLDHIEIGSFISLAAVLNSQIRIKNALTADLGLILRNFERLGIFVKKEDQDILVEKDQEMEIRYDDRNFIPKIDDAPWPGFPADLTSIMVITASQCKGSVLIFEKLFESRLFWVDKLITMGAQIVLCDPHRALVSGPTPLQGSVLSSPDIRAGMALLIAALCAKGESEIHNIYQIDRGYEKIDERLNSLGAKIQRIVN